MKLYVGNLPHAMDNNDLQQLFEQYGEIVSANIIMDRDTGRSRGFGFVEMNDKAQAEAAIEALNGSEVQGRTLTVNEARPKTDRGGRERRGPHRGRFEGGRR